MVNDFYSQVDIQNATGWTKVDLTDSMDQQTIFNGSALSVDVSFDGATKHAILATSGPTQAMTWDHHKRSQLWLRRTDLGAGGGAQLVDVLAARSAGYLR